MDDFLKQLNAKLDDIMQLITLMSSRLDSKDQLDKMHSDAIHRINIEIIELREIFKEHIAEASKREDQLQAFMSEVTLNSDVLIAAKKKLFTSYK